MRGKGAGCGPEPKRKGVGDCMVRTWKDVRLEANVRGELNAREDEDGHLQLVLRWEGCEEGRPPHLTLAWSQPLVDMQFAWHPRCGFDRSLRVDWAAPLATKVSSSAPVFCFYNAKGRNRLTVALSDAKTLLYSSLGVREEDGRLNCRVEVPLDASAGAHEYRLTLYRNQEDVSFAQALRAVSRWWEEACGLTPSPVPPEAKQAMYSSWYSFHQATVAGEIEAECAEAAALGMGSVIVDDGWQTEDGSRGYAYCGDWQVAEGKIPDMAAHVARVHALGMKYLLWYSVPFMGYRSKGFPAFEDKLLCKLDRMQAGVLDPRYPQVRRYLIDTYLRALEAYDLDGFKLDFIDSFSAGEGETPPWRPGMDIALVEQAVDRLMTDVLGALRARKPDILVEFRQSYIGPAMRGFGNMFRVGDCPADALSNRVGTLDLRMTSGDTAVHSDMLMWHRDDRDEAVALQLLSVAFAVPQISVRLEGLRPSHRELLAFWLGFLREQRELLLETPLEVEAPQNLYSLVRAEKDERAVIALYEGGRLADLHAQSRRIQLLNATAEERVVLCSPTPRRFLAETFDCRGRAVDRRELLVEACTLLAVPACGLARLTAL